MYRLYSFYIHLALGRRFEVELGKKEKEVGIKEVLIKAFP